MCSCFFTVVTFLALCPTVPHNHVFAMQDKLHIAITLFENSFCDLVVKKKRIVKVSKLPSVTVTVDCGLEIRCNTPQQFHLTCRTFCQFLESLLFSFNKFLQNLVLLVLENERTLQLSLSAWHMTYIWAYRPKPMQRDIFSWAGLCFFF